MFDPRRASQGDGRQPSSLPSCKTPWLAGWLSHRKSCRSGPGRKRDATSDTGCYSACSLILNSVSFHDEFLLLCAAPPRPIAHSVSQPLRSRACCLRGSALMTKVRVCLLMHKHSSCLATHPHAANNSALMEMFNIACWSPVGAVDGPVVCSIGTDVRSARMVRRIKVKCGVSEYKVVRKEY